MYMRMFVYSSLTFNILNVWHTMGDGIVSHSISVYIMYVIITSNFNLKFWTELIHNQKQDRLPTKTIMTESDEEQQVNGHINVSKVSGDESIDITFENPFVKFVRGFLDVPDESVRKMRYDSFWYSNEFYSKNNNINFSSIHRDSDLMQRDWSALSDDDLKLFGFENELLRREMLVKFSNTPNQALHYDKFVWRWI